MNGNDLWHVLMNTRWPDIPRLTAGWEWAALGVLIAAVGVLVLWEDWRVALLGWVAVGAGMSLLLVRLVPVPWALSRLLVVGLEGTLFWLGARRWPRSPLRLGGGLWVRLPILAVAGIAVWQLQPYVRIMWPDSGRGNAALVLTIGGILLMALHGDGLRGILGLLLWLNATMLTLAQLPVPTDWFVLLSLLDLLIATVGSIGLSSEGGWARMMRRVTQ